MSIEFNEIISKVIIMYDKPMILIINAVDGIIDAKYSFDVTTFKCMSICRAFPHNNKVYILGRLPSATTIALVRFNIESPYNDYDVFKFSSAF